MSQTKPVAASSPSATALTGEGLQTAPWSVSRVLPADLLVVWQKLLPQIRRSLRKGLGDTLSERRLFRGVASEELHLWVVHSGSEVLAGVFLQLEEREQGTALIVLDVVAGTGHGFKSYAERLLPRIRVYGDMVGAYTIESYSRLGAARVLQRLGCKPKAIVMELR